MSRFYRIQPPLLTSLPEGEQHRQQVGVVDDAVFVDVFVAGVACACAAEGEQHRQQVGIIDAAVAIRVARAPSVEQVGEVLPRFGVASLPDDVASIGRDGVGVLQDGVAHNLPKGAVEVFQSACGRPAEGAEAPLADHRLPIRRDAADEAIVGQASERLGRAVHPAHRKDLAPEVLHSACDGASVRRDARRSAAA